MNNVLNIIIDKVYPAVSYETFNPKNVGPLLDNKLTTFLNPHSYYHLRSNLNLLRNFDYIFIDSMFLAFILGKSGIIKTKPVSFDMSSLAPIVLGYLNSKKLSLYIVGTKRESLLHAVENIKLQFPAIEIIGKHEGYFEDKKQRLNVIDHVVRSNPSAVIVGMGARLQEEFLTDLKENGWAGAGFTCGGFLHQIAEKIDYYPDWAIKFNLRWLYRIFKEPKLIPRYFIRYPYSFLLFLTDLIKYKIIQKF